jgi:hypothetical protein
VFTAEGRALYNLEQLWADAPRIDWKAEALPSTRVLNEHLSTAEVSAEAEP